jgi:hypothetical protein
MLKQLKFPYICIILFIGSKMSQKWQEALERWDTWVDSVKRTKDLIQIKYGGITKISQRLSDLLYLKDIGSLTDDLKPEIKKLGLMYRSLINEVEVIGRDFISRNMGLGFRSLYHAYLLDYWKYSIHPELMPYYGEEIKFVEESQINVWKNSKIEKRDGKDEIVDSVSWYRGKATLKDIIWLIKSPLWPEYKSIKEKSDARRPSKKFEIDMESIVYSFLKEQGMKHKEISSIIGYKDQKDDRGNALNRTIGDRIKRGRELRRLCGNEKNITDN